MSNVLETFNNKLGTYGGTLYNVFIMNLKFTDMSRISKEFYIQILRSKQATLDKRIQNSILFYAAEDILSHSNNSQCRDFQCIS